MPSVSIIIPCYNEEATITLLLEAIQAQTYPVEEMEVIIADGHSTDRTLAAIATYSEKHPSLAVRVVENPRRFIPSALNRALEAAQGEFIVRLDGHSMPAKDYVERCVHALQEGRGDNVGGVWQIQPGGHSWIAQSIAAAASHPLGVGDARYRLGGQAQVVDTVPFGAFRRALVARIGMFDETLLTNEDYEFNVRVRQSGGQVWMDPQIQSVYFARSTLQALAHQYLRYGYWKAQMLKRYPETIRWRQFLPPAFVASLIVLFVLAPWMSMARWFLLIELGLYTLALLAAGTHAAIRNKQPHLIVGLPLSIATMHLTWGAALLWGLLFPAQPAQKRKS
ncbi:MAG TPA: glycosyltransferase family 2 protein [Anaerolineales bacterium]|nr:glycosyltransferase family 2 protein [Anaerolineales bacterium]